jgi:hypothetical protein
MTSETYHVRGRPQSTAGGSVILAVVSSLSFVLVIAGLYYAAGDGPRQQRALAAAGCEPNLSPEPASVPCTTVWDLERQYTKITTSAIQQLTTDVAAYTASERKNLAAAEAALTAQVTTAQAFDASLRQFPFPPAVAPQATALIQAIAARVKLIGEQARSSSLTQLRSFNAGIDASAAKIQTDMNIVHKALYTRPTATQEPS